MMDRQERENGEREGVGRCATESKPPLRGRLPSAGGYSELGWGEQHKAHEVGRTNVGQLLIPDANPLPQD